MHIATFPACSPLLTAVCVALIATAACGTDASPDTKADAGGQIDAASEAGADAADAGLASDTPTGSDTQAIDTTTLTDVPSSADATSTDAVAADSGGDAGASGDAVAQSVPLDALADALLGAVCQSMLNCAAASGDGLSFATVEGCKAFAGDEGVDNLETIVALVKAGTIAYDPKQAALCLAAAASQCADESDQQLAACVATFTGSVPDGGVCSVDEACKSLRCQQESDSCPGVCVAKIPAGQACEQTSSCVAGLSCKNGTCGDPTPVAAGKPCVDPTDCAKGLYCDQLMDLPVCKPAVLDGADCGAALCAAGLYCELAPDSKDGKCTAQIPAGGACEPGDFSGPGGACAVGSCMTVGGTSTCVVKPGLGGACSGTLPCKDADVGCVADANGQGKCTLLPAKGAKCQQVLSGTVSFEACQPPASCKNGTCSDPPGDKEPCGVEGLCAMGTTCGVAGLCVKLPGLDQECFGECQAGLQCTGGESGPGKCIAQVCK